MPEPDDEKLYQKPNKYVEFLPYYEDLKSEAEEQLGAVKAGLAQSILWRDLRPALIHWACELDRYIYLYGYRFSKDDHILFVKTIYELVIMPGLEFRIVKTFCQILGTLLKKRNLLNRKDLVLDWRPLYKLYNFVTYKSLEEDGLFLLPKDLSKSVEQLISRARIYFPANSTAEILAEFRPLMCVWDTSFMKACHCLNLFLPTLLTPEEHETYGFKLWLDEISFWLFNINNEPPWEVSLYDLLSRLTLDNVGYVRLESFVDEIFTKILRSFKLTVMDKASGGDHIEIGFNGKTVDYRIISTLLVSCMGNGSTVPAHLDRLLTALDSYLHPSNNGGWQGKILDFMQNLAFAFCKRLYVERHRKPDWTTTVPDEYKITDKEIEHFVQSVLPLALNGMFSKSRSDVAVNCIRYLSMMSPEIVLPAVLEKVYPALDTLVEPHRLIQTFRTLSCIVVPMVRDTKRAGLRAHAIRLMDCILPGMDPNDVAKSMLTLQILSLFTLLVPVVDCSEAPNIVEDLTEEEKEICLASAVFENYVNLYMDRLFAIMETFSGSGGAAGSISRRRGSNVRFNAEETSIKGGLYASFRSLLGNCSTEIYDVVVNRLYNFLSDFILEGKITAEILGELCFSAIRTNPRRSLGKFMSLLTKRLSAIIEDEHFNPNDEDLNVLWYLTMCTQIVRCEGSVLVSHKKDIIKLLNLLSPLKSKEIYMKFGELLENLCLSLSFIYVCDHELDRKNLDSPLDVYLPIRHWADYCNLKDYQPNWHAPGPGEMQFLSEIFEMFVFDEFERLEKPNNLKKADIHKSLRFIAACLSGSTSVIPVLEGQAFPSIESHVEMAKFSYLIGPKSLQTLSYNGKNIRNYCYEKLTCLITFLLGEREDETKCLPLICTIYSIILFQRGLTKAKYDGQRRALGYTKAYLLDTILGKKSSPKSLTNEYVTIEHHKRLVERSSHTVTDTHLAIARDIIKLSTSNYSEVRRSAQSVFDVFMNTFSYSYRFLLDEILFFLVEKPEISHEQFKGALYLLIGSSASRSLLTRHHWKTLIQIWPAVIKAQHSEKPSIVRLIDSIQNMVVENLQSFQINLNFNENCTELAKQFWTRGYKPSLPCLDKQQLEDSINEEQERNDRREKQYYELIKELTALSNDSKLHWRHADMAQSFLSLLIRIDMKFPPDATHVFVRLLVHDSIKTRKMSVALLAAVLKIHRKKPPTIKVKSAELFKKLVTTGATDLQMCKDVKPLISTEVHWPIKWGLRPDNNFLIYDPDNVPRSKEAWNACTFVEKTHIGFYCWPEEVKIYLPSVQRDEKSILTDETGLYAALSDEKFVEKFSTLMSVEDDKDNPNIHEEQFNATIYLFFQSLCRTYGTTCLEHFKPIMQKFVKSTKLSEQKFASEFVCGLLSGSKLWSHETFDVLWKEFIGPLLRSAFENITTENYQDWGVSLATVFDSREPKKLYWFIDLLLELAEKPVESSFNAASRLFLLQGAVHQQEWRVLPLWFEILEIIKPLLCQPYQNLRDRLGSVLCTAFSVDIPHMAVDGRWKPPNKKEFLVDIHRRLEVLYREVDVGHPSDASATLYANGESTDERKQAILLLKTMLCFLNTQWSSWFEPVTKEIVKFLSILCYFENETSDDELKRDCRWQLMRGMARAVLNEEIVDLVLDKCQEVAKNKWWKCRVSVLKFLQVSLFSNLYNFSTTLRIKRVKQIIMDLLHDVQLDVREAASGTLSSLLHIGYWTMNDSLTDMLRKWSAKENTEIVRHAGVLGCAAIIRSCPYTVPSYLPDVLMSLCPHAGVSGVIGSTVKKCLSDFKRTHQDSWHEHKECFTDDQLCVLTDLLVSPSYYI